jgi:hypothetical protein
MQDQLAEQSGSAFKVDKWTMWLPDGRPVFCDITEPLPNDRFAGYGATRVQLSFQIESAGSGPVLFPITLPPGQLHFTREEAENWIMNHLSSCER